MVELDAVGLRYAPSRDGTRQQGTQVLQDLCFHVPEGGFRWLLGASGAGKTSLLRLLYLAVRPSSGALTLLGESITDAPRRRLPVLRRQIGMVFQDFRLLPHLTAFDPRYWLMMQGAMMCGFATSYPMNRVLIGMGLKEKM